MTQDQTAKRVLLDAWQVADYLNTTERWVRRAIAERRFPVVKLGAQVRVDRDDLDRYIETHRVPARTTPK